MRMYLAADARIYKSANARMWFFRCFQYPIASMATGRETNLLLTASFQVWGSESREEPRHRIVFFPAHGCVNGG